MLVLLDHAVQPRKRRWSGWSPSQDLTSDPPDAVDPNDRPAVEHAALFGSWQKPVLAAWPSLHPGQPTLVLSQTTYATVKTTPAGGKQSDPDNDAFVQARNRALAHREGSPCRHVCGDQHLGSTAATYQIESWAWDVDPTTEGAAPFPGWPVVVPFAEA